MSKLSLLKRRLGREFFNRHATEVARDMLGQILVFGNHQAIITETEAYRGLDDPASHAYRGPTPRSQIMFGEPGVSYVYFIYGMYYCLNVVTEEEGSPSAVLIRAAKLLTLPYNLLGGPGILCRELGITKTHNAIDLTINEDFFIASKDSMHKIVSSPRIGINVGLDKHWRFTTILDVQDPTKNP